MLYLGQMFIRRSSRISLVIYRTVFGRAKLEIPPPFDSVSSPSRSFSRVTAANITVHLFIRWLVWRCERGAEKAQGFCSFRVSLLSDPTLWSAAWQMGRVAGGRWPFNTVGSWARGAPEAGQGLGQGFWAGQSGDA